MREVPDPYYGGDDGFAEVVTMLEAASTGLQDAISKHHNILGHGRQG
jgi:protein-tyrosine phosphatase